MKKLDDGILMGLKTADQCNQYAGFIYVHLTNSKKYV